MNQKLTDAALLAIGALVYGFVAVLLVWSYAAWRGLL